jgi:uncharacterized cupin superfamily protein
LHKHDDTEQIFYILEGEGMLTIEKEEREYPVQIGDIVRIPASVYHSIRAEGGKKLRYLAIDCFIETCFTGEEKTWDEHVKVLCKEQGWDYEKVISTPV